MALDRDIEWDEALAQLSEPSVTNGFSRRAFLQAAAVGAAGSALATMPGVVRADRAWGAAAPVPLSPNEGILVLIAMYGGNDGLNTLVPFGSGRYNQLRPNIAIAQNRVLPLNGAVGLHPNLTNMKALYDQGHLAVIQGVGYPNPSLSHFDSMAIWMAGHSSGGNPGSGWLGRYLDGLPPDVLTGVTLGTSVPLILKGNYTSGIGLPDSLGAAFGADRTNADDARMFDAVKAFAGGPQNGVWGDHLAANEASTIDLGGRLQPSYTNLNGSGLERDLTLVARLINANLGIRVLNVGFSGFDNHAEENPNHDPLMTELDTALHTFFGLLDPRLARQVTVMTYSEFGRRPESNDSGGTDHGTASVLFVAGANVRGGLYGAYPSLTDLDGDQNLKFSVDFRSVYTSILGPWLGADPTQVIGAAYEDLHLFTAGPGVDPSSPGIGGYPNPRANGGYWMVTAQGGVLAYGNAGQWGSAPAGTPIAAIAARPGRDGYWLVEPHGRVWAFGAARNLGDVSGTPLAGSIVALSPTPSGNGYWLLGSDGGIFSFGDAAFYGSMGGHPLNAPIVGLAPTASGKGYWLVGRDGGIFSFGDAAFYGSMGGHQLNAPVVTIARTASGKGYWLSGSDGGLFSFGDAGFYGSTGSTPLAAPVIGMRPSPAGRGYWLVASDGGVFAFGDAGFYGSSAGTGQTIVGLGA